MNSPTDSRSSSSATVVETAGTNSVAPLLTVRSTSTA